MLNRHLILHAAAVIVFATAGCRGRVLTSDQRDFRCHLLDLYTDQILDNLIRAKQGLPFVQLDYTNVTGTITDTGNGMFVLAAPVNDTTYTIGAQRVTQLTVTANPVIDKPDVYQAYLDYLQKTPDGLFESPEAPPAGAALVCKRYCDSFWWVPIDKREEFKQLSLRTTTMRGQPLTASNEFERNIDDAIALKGNPKLPFQHSVEVTFDKELPRLRGNMRVVFDDVVHNLVIQPPNGSAGKGAQKFKVLFAQTAPGGGDAQGTLPFTGEELAAKIKGKTAWITFEGYQPEPSQEKEALDAIFHQQQLQRLSTVH